MSEKSAYQLLLEMAPEDKKSDIERIFRQNDRVEDENDGLFQIVLVMGIYQDFFKNFPERFKKTVDEFHRNANAELKAMVKITKINAKIEKQIQYFTVTMYILIFMLAVLMAGNYLSNSFLNTFDGHSKKTIDMSGSGVKPEIPEKEKTYINYID